jgi:hypothetical protein
LTVSPSCLVQTRFPPHCSHTRTGRHMAPWTRPFEELALPGPIGLCDPDLLW